METLNDIEYVDASILDVDADVIVHQVNCIGIMGSGVAKAIVTRYPEILPPYQSKARAIRKGVDRLGEAQIIECGDGKYICNIFSQFDYGYDGALYTRYEALYAGLEKVAKTFHGVTIAIPWKIGCNRGGGDWKIVQMMIEKLLGPSDNRILICKY